MLVDARQTTVAVTHTACQAALQLFELSSSLLDCLGRVGRVKAKPHAVASRALTQRPGREGRQLSRRMGKDQGAASSAGRTAVRRAINSGDERSLTDTSPRRSGHVTGPEYCSPS